MSYDPLSAQALLAQHANLRRWHERAKAVRTHEHCQLGSEHIELVIARALETAYQDGMRDGSLEARKTALGSIVANAEAIAADMERRVTESRKELAELRAAKPSVPAR